MVKSFTKLSPTSQVCHQHKNYSLLTCAINIDLTEILLLSKYFYDFRSIWPLVNSLWLKSLGSRIMENMTDIPMSHELCQITEIMLDLGPLITAQLLHLWLASNYFFLFHSLSGKIVMVYEKIDSFFKKMFFTL